MAKYQHLSALNNTVRDVNDLEKLLKQHGFQTFKYVDLKTDDLTVVLNRFKQQTQGAEEAIVFYSGHGMAVVQDGGLRNIIAPVDAKISCENRQAENVIAMRTLFRITQHIPKRVFLFDACRNNPYLGCAQSSRKQGSGYSTIGAEFLNNSTSKTIKNSKGFAPVSRQSASALVAFSTDLGSLASDGAKGGNSPFAEKLIEQLKENPKKPLLEVLTATSKNVATSTAHYQVPWVVTKGGEPHMCLSGRDCQTRKALITTNAVEQRLRLISLIKAQLSKGDYGTALLLALEASELEKESGSKERSSEVSGLLSLALSKVRDKKIFKHDAKIERIAVSEKGDLLASFDDKEMLVIWDAKAGRKRGKINLLNLLKKKNFHHDVKFSFSKNGKYFGFMSDTANGNTLLVWNVTADGRLGKLILKRAGVGSFAWWNQTNSVGFTEKDEPVVVRYDLSRKKVVKRYRARVKERDYLHDGLTISPDGKRLASFYGQHVLVWNARSGRRLSNKYKRFTHMGGHMGSGEFTFNSKHLIVADGNGLKVFSARNGRYLRKLDENKAIGLRFAEGGGFDVSVNMFAVSPDSRKVVTTLTRAGDQRAIVWDLVRGQVLRVISLPSGPVNVIRFQKDSKSVIGLTEDGPIRVWGVNNRRLDRTIATFVREGIALSKSRDDRWFWALSSAGQIRSYGRDQEQSIVLRGPDAPVEIPVNVSLGNPVNRADRALSPDGRKIAILWSSRLVIYDLVSQKNILTKNYPGPLERGSLWWDTNSHGIKVHRRGKDQYICLNATACGDDKTFGKWRAEFSPSENTGGFIWSSQLKPALKKTMRIEKFFKGNPVVSVGQFYIGGWRWNPGDGNISGKFAHVWNAKTGQYMYKITGHNGGVERILESPSGKYLISIGRSLAIIWDGKSGRLIRKLNLPRDTYFGKDGSLIAYDVKVRQLSGVKGPRKISRVEDVYIRIFRHFDSDDENKAKSSIPRCLTPEQRREFVLNKTPPAWCIDMKKWPYGTADWKAKLSKSDAN